MSILDKFIHYYHEQIFSTTKKKNILNPSTDKYFIIDYANIIHILYDKYRDVELIFKKINQFLHKYSKTNLIFIVAKPVIIEGRQLNVSVPVLKGVYVFNIEYQTNISSNIDDLLSHFLCVVIFVGLLRLNIEPKNKIFLVTNDKQNFQKNLFEITDDEKRSRIDLLKDIKINETVMGKTHKIRGINRFLKEYMTYEKNTSIKCSIPRMTKVVRKRDFSYNNLNAMQKKITSKCMKHSRQNGKLKKYLYLYVYIKYIQSYLNGDFYGSMSKEKIISLFR